jgi:hypothetical protein
MFTAFKFLSQTCVTALPGMEPNPKKCPAGEVDFSRPVLSAFMMVSSMSLALIYYFGFLKGKPGVHPVTKKQLIYTVLPSFLDLICASTLMAGSMKIPMSLVLTLKGVRVLFSAILVILVFKRKQRMYNWAGVGIALTGVGLAVLSAILNNNVDPTAAATKSTGATIMGIGLILGSEFFRSLMVVSQEYLIKVVGCDPSFMIGLQGIYGGILMVGFLVVSWLWIPGNDLDGSFENLKATFLLAGESTPIIIVLCILPIFVVLGFISSALVTKHLSSVHNAMATVLMTAFVWLIEILIHYAIDRHRGNAWGPYSYLQLIGFAFVVVALLVYDGQYIKLPGFEYTTESKLDVEARVEIQNLKSEGDIGSVDCATVASNEPVVKNPSA